MSKSTKKSESAEAKVSAKAPETVAAAPAALAAWSEMMTESADFLAGQFQQNLETQTALLDCRSPADFMRIQSDHFQRTIEQYSSEANRMFEAMFKGTKAVIDETRSAERRRYDDIPL